MIEKKIFSLVASIIKFFIFYLFFLNAYADTVNKKYYHNEQGILSLMYHRFDENKYPSTNIRMDVFKKQIEMIKTYGFEFFNPTNFDKEFNVPKTKKKILLTIDDGFSSFYDNAWPILKQKKIPFIIFINTETIGSNGYMNWSQIKEISSFNFVHIGNHSHTHGYLVDKSDDEIKKDLETSIKIFKDKINHKTKFFAYPFGEYKKSYIEIVKKLGFEYGFGQHSGVMDITKNKFELPRFPINEKYGEEKRFKTILNTIPFPYIKITPDDKYIKPEENPPDVKVTFFENGPNIKNINCYSNEENKWRKSKVNFTSNNEMKILLQGKFITERGRINCSLRENTGEWRWLGIQFVISNL